MEKNSQKSEIIVSVVFLIVLILFINPFGLWMPDTLLYMFVAGLSVIFALFAGIIWKETPRDEREMIHSMRAARVGYLLGVTVLVLGIVYESIASHVDVWLIIALGVMVLGRLIGFIYNSLRN